MQKVMSMQGPLFRQRMVIKSVPDADSFLNRRYDNEWKHYTGPLKAGTYAFVGQEWRNVKTLDASLLAHV